MTANPPPGMVVGGYRLGATLGVGTFGKVKFAFHEATGQKVAVKIINRARMYSMEMQEKICRELSIVRRLCDHPHIIKLYELIDTPSDIFMVMEYVSGGEMFDYIVQKSRLQEAEARRFFQQIISGVDYCHQHLVCHRDLKPENVLLDVNLAVKVGDFGLSNFMHDGEFQKTSCGSPNYAAPEVVSGKAYAGPEVDVWSCGVILFALLCGSLPFDDEHVPNLFKKIKHGHFTLPGHLSEQARRLIVRMLVVDPVRRLSLKEVKRNAWYRGGGGGLLGSSVGSQLPDLYTATGVRTSTGLDMDVVRDLIRLGYTVDVNRLARMVSRRTSSIRKQRTEYTAYKLLQDRVNYTRNSSSVSIAADSAHDTYVFSREIRKRAAAAAVFHNATSPFGLMSFSDSLQLAGCRVLPRMSSASSASSTDTLTAGPNRAPNSGVPRWRVGVESLLDAPTAITTICHTLRSIGYEWRAVHPFKFWCRQVPYYCHSEARRDGEAAEPWAYPSDAPSASLMGYPVGTAAAADESGKGLLEREPSDEPAKPQSEMLPPLRISPRDKTTMARSAVSNVTLAIQVFKSSIGRCVVDIQVFDGPIPAAMSSALWVLFAIYTSLAQRPVTQ